MAKVIPYTLVLATLITTPVIAQDGGQLYGLYCSACHAEDGKGANDGLFPPLAGSDWLQETPERAISVVLKGLQGPVSVSGKPYNLAMPPHEGSMDDPTIAAILTYVKSSWGNTGEKVTPEMVGATRAKQEERSEPWTGKELLKLYPLPKQSTPLENLTSRTYAGQWKSIPDFTKLEAQNIEEEQAGLIDLNVLGLKNNFGVVWEADFMAPVAGSFDFELLADDGGRVILNGNTVAELNGKGPMKQNRKGSGSTILKKGKNVFRVEYFQATTRKGIDIKWKESKAKTWQSLVKATKKAKTAPKPIMLKPANGKTVMYRNFIYENTPRAISFGFPGSLNLSYSADDLAPMLVWSGSFLDVSQQWTNRGQGKIKPASTNVEKLAGNRYLPKEARFRGYSLDKDGNPTFMIQIDDRILSDSWKPGETGTLIRTLELSGEGPNLEIPLANKEVTGADNVTVKPGTPATVTYNLK